MLARRGPRHGSTASLDSFDSASSYGSGVSGASSARRDYRDVVKGALKGIDQHEALLELAVVEHMDGEGWKQRLHCSALLCRLLSSCICRNLTLLAGCPQFRRHAAAAVVAAQRTPLFFHVQTDMNIQRPLSPPHGACALVWGDSLSPGALRSLLSKAKAGLISMSTDVPQACSGRCRRHVAPQRCFAATLCLQAAAPGASRAQSWRTCRHPVAPRATAAATAARTTPSARQTGGPNQKDRRSVTQPFALRGPPFSAPDRQAGLHRPAPTLTHSWRGLAAWMSERGCMTVWVAWISGCCIRIICQRLTPCVPVSRLRRGDSLLGSGELSPYSPLSAVAAVRRSDSGSAPTDIAMDGSSSSSGKARPSPGSQVTI